MNQARYIFFGLIAAAIAIVGYLFAQNKEPKAKSGDLVMFCAAGMRVPMERIVEQYEFDYKVKIDVQYEGSGTLLGKLSAGSEADIYLAADTSYTDLAEEQGLIEETMTVCYLTAGIAVAKGNPKGISELGDLLRDDVRVGIGNPEAASVGKFTKKVLTKAGIWEKLEPRLELKVPTVNEIANAAKLGTVDAVIIWDSVAAQYPELEFINVAEFDAEIKSVTVAVGSKSKYPTAALRFCRYLTARDRGLAVFKEEKYQAVEGDKWDLRPELTFYSGAMLKPAIEDALKRFQEREGVTVNTVYNGCGILVSQMKAGKNPDAYFSCDVSFMEVVSEKFGESLTVAANDMVILVNKGNPKSISGPADLAKEGIKVGLAHPEKSALGKLTQDYLQAQGLLESVRDNLEVPSPTGDFLVNQLRAGSLDAVVVYRSNAKAHPATMEECDIVDLGKDAFAEQPFAVGINSDHKALAGRLFDALVEENASFVDKGFEWKLDQRDQ